MLVPGCYRTDPISFLAGFHTRHLNENFIVFVFIVNIVHKGNILIV